MKVNQDVWQFVRFGLVGLSNTLLSYLLYASCVYMGIHYLAANAVAFILCVLHAWYWSNRYVFRKAEGESRSAWRSLLKTYVAYGFTGLFLASLLLWLFVEQCGLSAYVAQLLGLFITVPLNFILNKFWSFKTTKTV